MYKLLGIFENEELVEIFAENDSHKTITKTINDFAKRFFNINDGKNEFTICVIDFQKNISTIYSFEVHRTISVTCTMY